MIYLRVAENFASRCTLQASDLTITSIGSYFKLNHGVADLSKLNSPFSLDLSSPKFDLIRQVLTYAVFVGMMLDPG